MLLLNVVVNVSKVKISKAIHNRNYPIYNHCLDYYGNYSRNIKAHESIVRTNRCGT